MATNNARKIRDEYPLAAVASVCNRITENTLFDIEARAARAGEYASRYSPLRESLRAMVSSWNVENRPSAIADRMFSINRIVYVRLCILSSR